jgi:uncharacterized cupredoxin-like copper-binding protein
MLRGAPRLLLVAAALALSGAACSGGIPAGALEAERLACPEGSDCYDAPRAPGDGGTFAMNAGDFYFDDFEGEVAEGDIQIVLNNEAAGTHNIVFIGANEGSDPKVEANGGTEAEGVVNLFAGDYTFYCSIAGHRAAGMEGSVSITTDPTPAAEAVAGEDEAA